MRDNGSRRGRFIVLRCVRPWIITAVSFHWMFPHSALLNPPRSLQPTSDQIDCCLPGHRQALRLRCFYHCRVTDVFTAVSIAGPVLVENPVHPTPGRNEAKPPVLPYAPQRVLTPVDTVTPMIWAWTVNAVFCPLAQALFDSLAERVYTLTDEGHRLPRRLG